MKTCADCSGPSTDYRCDGCRRRFNRERMKRWRARNPEKARAKSRESTAKLRAEQPDYFRDWYRANAERERARSRRSMRAWRLAHPEANRERQQRFFARHPDRRRAWDKANTHNRRALRATTNRSLLGGYSFAYMTAYIADLLTQPCEYCDGPGGTLDHVIPLSRGGLHIPTNLASACLGCNLSKGTRMLSEWTR